MKQNQDLKLARITPDTLIVGIDVAKKTHWARMINYQGVQQSRSFSINNNIDGFESLESKILEVKQKGGFEDVIIGMEPTGHYWKPLAWYLYEKGITVVTVNPYHVKKSKELDDNSPGKEDKKDALIIARLIQQGRFFEVYLPDDVYAELRGLSNLRQQQKAKLNAAINALEAILDEYFPEYAEVFKNLLGKGSLYILRHCPFPSDVLAADKDAIVIGTKEATNFIVGARRIDRLITAAQRSIGVKNGLESAKLKLNSILDEIEFLVAQKERTEQAMAEQLDKTGIKEYPLSIPGIGIVTAASFLGEVGDLKRFTHWKQIRKLAGLNLAPNSSGKREGKTIISKRGRKVLRCILYQAAVVMVAKNPEFKALYEYLKHRKDNPLTPKQALVVISIKLIRLLYTLGSKKERYDPAKVLGNIREQQIAQAA
jgi:transposase